MAETPPKTPRPGLSGDYVGYLLLAYVLAAPIAALLGGLLLILCGVSGMSVLNGPILIGQIAALLSVTGLYFRGLRRATPLAWYLVIGLVLLSVFLLSYIDIGAGLF